MNILVAEKKSRTFALSKFLFLLERSIWLLWTTALFLQPVYMIPALINQPCSFFYLDITAQEQKKHNSIFSYSSKQQEKDKNTEIKSVDHISKISSNFLSLSVGNA